MPLVFPGQEVRLNEPGRMFERHHHLRAYAAILISGSCHEAGDRGRYTASPGDVFVHRAFDGHGDRVGRAGATFINIPLDRPVDAAFGQVTDLDALIRAFEHSFAEGCERFYAHFEPADRQGGDWPDMLAHQLAKRSVGSIADWSDVHGLNPASVSRGFRLAYGISPKRFRLEQMAALAARTVCSSDSPLCRVAAEVGFADQAHMTRSLAALFEVTPRRLRRLS